MKQKAELAEPRLGELPQSGEKLELATRGDPAADQDLAEKRVDLPVARTVEEAGRALVEVVRMLEDAVAETGFVRGGNVAPWATEGRRLSLVETVVIAFVSRQNLVVEGNTAEAKTLFARCLANLLVGADRSECVSVTPSLSDDIFTTLQAGQGGVSLVPSKLCRARAVVLDEANRGLAGVQTPTLKRMLNLGMFIIMTQNPAGKAAFDIHAGGDASIFSSALVVQSHHATSWKKRAALHEQPRLRIQDVPVNALEYAGRVLFEALASVHEAVQSVPLNTEARKMLAVLDQNACCHGPKCNHWPAACRDCPVQSTSGCGNVGALPAAGMRLATLGKAYVALRGSQLSRDFIVRPEDLHLFLPLIASVTARCVEPQHYDRQVEINNSFWNGIRASIRRFENKFPDVIARFEREPDLELHALPRPVQHAVQAFSRSDNPSVPLGVLAVACTTRRALA